MLKLAVISGPGIYEAINWTLNYAREHGQVIESTNIARCLVVTNTTEYSLIQRKDQINGNEFNGYLVCPTYEDLIKLVQTRIRLNGAS